jgi:hypothetical protein
MRRNSGKMFPAVVVLSTLLCLLIVAVPLVQVGCTKRVTTVTNLPTGVSEKEVQNWYAATGMALFAATTLNDATKALVDLNRQGFFKDGPAYGASLGALQKMLQAQKEVDEFLRATPQQFGKLAGTKLDAFADILVTEAQTANFQAMAGIKDPNKAQELVGIITKIQALAGSVRLLAVSGVARTP